MFKRIFTTIATLGLLFTAQVFAAKETVKVVNKTTYTVIAVFRASGCAGTYSVDVGPDLLEVCNVSQDGVKIIAPGDYASFDFKLGDTNHRVNISLMGESEMISRNDSNYDTWNEYLVGKSFSVYDYDPPQPDVIKSHGVNDINNVGGCTASYGNSSSSKTLTLNKFVVTSIVDNPTNDVYFIANCQ